MFFKKNKDKQNKDKGKSSKDKKKSKKEKARYVKICPRCGSINVKIGNQGGSAGVVFGAPTMYRCLSCGYVNYAFPEIDANELETRLNEKTEEEKSK